MQAGEDTGAAAQAPDWPLRPLILAGLGLVAGLLVHLVMSGVRFEYQLSAVQAASISGIALAAVLTGFTLERRLWWASILFSLATALVAALVIYWNGSPGGWSASEGWRTISLLLAVAIAAPLFQAARDENAPRFPYATVHDHAWTNVVLWCACCLFVVIVFLMAWLLSALFELIKIHLLCELLEKEWFWRALIGLAFGAGLGLLRENDAVVRLLQRVVATVLAVLAPVLAIGLALFLLALPFTGLQALWDATSATTPILLFCVVGALILANAVIGNMPEHERRFPLLRYGAMVLAATILPLAIIAAIATGLRIGQYGFTPERLWAMVFVTLACLYGAAYLVSLALGRLGWAARVRPANLALAFVTCGIALLLATPLVSFNAISTRDQLARLESGRVKPEEFDWRALAFDFGTPGKAALEKLRRSANATIRAGAENAARADSRWEVQAGDEAGRRRAETARNVRLLPKGGAMPAGLLETIASSAQCSGNSKCTLSLLGAQEALLFSDQCFERGGVSRTDRKTGKTISGYSDCGIMSRYVLIDGKWAEPTTDFGKVIPGDPGPRGAAYREGRIEIRKVERRQVFIGDVPVGEAFE
ncbi:MAG: DUF4153 domain-containing protein [Sphingomonas sp.]|uniref:DUF4153 domain-containing protein n=1 Tax=Sphingomonas sp. TaxID=28214 RepID=UPI001B2915DB|nr:DUF4153 domain-containing protein [Sphingomonas sp.]MBO9624663.1 DUF4153 domain-containing protein [Sphingomonas sp.]